MKASIIKNSLTVSDKEYFNSVNRHHIVTNDCICINYETNNGLTEETLPIFKMKHGYKAFTPYSMARNTGKYIVVAYWDHYTKFDLNGKLVSIDANDDNTDN